MKSYLCVLSAMVLCAPCAEAQDPGGASLIQRLADADATVRRGALDEIRRLGAQGVEHAPAVAVLLADRDLPARRAAVAALVAVRPDLGSLAKRLDALVTEVIEEEISESWEIEFEDVFVRDVAPMLERLDSEDPAVRAQAVKDLCWIGEPAAEHRARILELLDDPSAPVRIAVVNHVLRMGWHEAARDALCRAFKDVEGAVRRQVAVALRDRDDAVVVAALRGALQDPELDVRFAVVESLGRSGTAGRAAANDLIATLRDRKGSVRLAALQAVGRLKIAGPRALAEILRFLDEPRDPNAGDATQADRRAEVTAALHCLSALRERAAPALDRTLELTRDADRDFRALALAVSWEIASDARRGDVVLRHLEALRDEDAVIQESVEWTLSYWIHPF